MKILRLFILMVVGSLSQAAIGNELIAKADSAYSNDDFAEALQLYTEAASTYGTSSDLYYNIGNCYYRLGELGNSIVAYERSLRLDPSNSDAKANLEFVNDKKTDRQGERGTFIGNMFDRMAMATSSNVWAATGLVLFTLLIAAAALYTFTSNIPLRKLGFFGGILLFILCVFSIVLSNRNASICQNDKFAIITVPSTILSTSPRTPKDRNEEAMLLHEGTKVEIRDSVSAHGDSTDYKWYDVQIDNEHRAWIKSSDVEKI